MSRNSEGSGRIAEAGQKTVLAFGEILWDLLPGGAVLGGAPFNFAYRIHTLGDRSLMVSRLGQDGLGDEALRQVESWGMSTRFIQRDERHPTGTVDVDFDSRNLPHYHITPGVAYDHIEITGRLLAAAAPADCFCFGTLSQRAPAARATLKALLESSRDSIKLLDINLRKDCYTDEIIRSSVRQAGVLKLNEEEARYLAELYGIRDRSIPAFSREILRLGELSACVVTLGDRGSFATSARGQVYTPGYRVQVVDSCGSGDAFTAGFVYRLLRGRPLRECAELGNAMGALVASQRGATALLETEAAERFLLGNPGRIRDKTLGAFDIDGEEPA